MVPEGADKRYATAQFNLALMFADDRGVERNSAENISWHRKAAFQGLLSA